MHKRRMNSIKAAPETGGIDYAPQSLDMEAAVNAFLRYCNIRNLTADTIQFYREGLTLLRKMLEAQEIRRPVDITKNSLYICIERRKAVVSENYG